MPDLEDGETCEIKGSAAKPYAIKNTGGVYSCSCPAWRNQSVAIESRTCKHIRRLRGEAAENERIGTALFWEIAMFWEIARDGTDVTVRYGRIGTNGTTKTKSLDDEAAAIKHAEKLVEQKTSKGSAEV
jgi:hypothetical protein